MGIIDLIKTALEIKVNEDFRKLKKDVSSIKKKIEESDKPKTLFQKEWDKEIEWLNQ